MNFEQCILLAAIALTIGGLIVYSQYEFEMKPRRKRDYDVDNLCRRILKEAELMEIIEKLEIDDADEVFEKLRKSNDVHKTTMNLRRCLKKYSL